MFTMLTVSSQQFAKVIVEPGFSDNNPITTPYGGTLNEFTRIPTGGRSKVPIINIKGVQNIMQRRDASCDLNYKKVMGASNRIITVDEIYAATKLCQNELYQGCMKDWDKNDPIFRQRILPFFRQAVYNDLVTNSYFGDIDRVGTLTNEYSTSSYDGVWKWLKVWTEKGVIPQDQTIQIPDTDNYFVTPLKAFQLIESMHHKQSRVLKSTPAAQKAYYVSQEIAEAYERYMISVGEGNTAYIQLVMNGISQNQLAYRSIRILVEPTWSPVLFELAGKEAYAAILTFRGNLCFGQDETYGEGPNRDEALRVWYENKDMTWYYQNFLKVGTNIALPEHVVYAISEF